MPVSDAALREGLERALGRPVPRFARRPFPYASSAPVEEVLIDGAAPLLFKDCTPRPGAVRPAFVADPRREAEVYAGLLDGLDAPACLGSVVDATRVWLFLERVDGAPLWQCGDLAAWEAAARWLARMHAAPVPARVPSRLLRHDEALLTQWVERAIAMAPPGTLESVRRPALRAVRRLAAQAPRLVHGELYPSNVLVQDGGGACPRIRPVDWETAGIGPGVLDLAALTSGAWDPARRAQVVAAYAGALPGGGVDLEAALDAARLVVALQWVGWSRGWTAPAAHRHDWLAEARALAGRIA